MARLEVSSQEELDALAAGTTAVVREGHYVARTVNVDVYGSATVCAYGSVAVWATDDVVVKAYDEVTVSAHDSANVTAWDKTTVSAHGRATVSAFGSAAVEVHDEATANCRSSAFVSAYDSSFVSAYNHSSVRAHNSATVLARDGASVTACDWTTVHASGAATVHAGNSATVRSSETATVKAADKATVEATETSTVVAYDMAVVRAHPFATVYRTPWHKGPEIVADNIVDLPDLDECDAETWLRYYGIRTENGKAVLYKAVHDDWQTDRRSGEWVYRPGETVRAEDYDTTRMCGGGLHLSPTPFGARAYLSYATKYVAVEVDVESLIPLDDKCKVRECRVLYEVDILGRKVDHDRLD